MHRARRAACGGAGRPGARAARADAAAQPAERRVEPACRGAERALGAGDDAPGHRRRAGRTGRPASPKGSSRPCPPERRRPRGPSPARCIGPTSVRFRAIPRGPVTGSDFAHRPPLHHSAVRPYRARADGAFRPSRARLTTGQALVRWLQAQWSERDGERRRAVPAMWGIFGHGNVLGLGQALAQEGGELAAAAAQARAVDGARRDRLRQGGATAPAPRLHGVDRPGRDATCSRAPRRPPSTACRCCCCRPTRSRRDVPASCSSSWRSPAAGDVTVNDAFRPLSRHFDRVARPEQLLTALPAALRVLLDPADTGAVTVALHQDVLGEAYDWPVEFFAARTWVVSRRPPAARSSPSRGRCWRGAAAAVIAGGGVRYSERRGGACDFAAGGGIPVAETSAGKGVMAAGPLNLGGIGVNGTTAARQVAERADLVICVGTRLTDFTTASLSLFQDPSVRFLGRSTCARRTPHKLGAAPVVADARLALEALAPSERRRPSVLTWSRRRPPGRPTSASGRRRRLRPPGGLLAVNATARAGDWVVAAAGWAPGDLLKLWTVPDGGHAHLEFGFSCMGHELPAALGIRLHEGPAGEVVVIVGDGSVLMAPGELLTAVQYGLKVTVVVVDNAGYGSIDALAQTSRRQPRQPLRRRRRGAARRRLRGAGGGARLPRCARRTTRRRCGGRSTRPAPAPHDRHPLPGRRRRAARLGRVLGPRRPRGRVRPGGRPALRARGRAPAGRASTARA